MTSLLLCAGALLVPDAAPLHRITERKTWKKTPALAVLLLVLLKGPVSLILSAMLVVGTIVWAIRTARQHARATAIRSHTSTFLGFVIGDLRAGNGMPHALGVAVDSLSPDAPSELCDAVRVAAARSAGGGDGANVLISSSYPDLVRVGQLWKVAARHGIPLVALCENAQRRIDAQLTHAAATRAALQGPKATAMVLSILPVVGIGMGGLLGADPLHFLLGGGTGGVLLVAGTGLTTAGFVWSQRIMGKATS